MLQHAFAPETGPQITPSPATYGALMDVTRTNLDSALARTEGRHDPQSAYAELCGYERFLRTAGIHLQLLTLTSGAGPENLLSLGRRLARVGLREASSSTWLTAAASLGAAHDLVASHVDVGLQARTPDGEDTLHGLPAIRASQRLVGLLHEARGAGDVLVRKAARAERGQANRTVTKTQLDRIRSTNSAVSVLTSASAWELSTLLGHETGEDLADLQPAAAPTSSLGRRTSLADSLAALRLLRQLSFLQARGTAHASPASLHDLSLIGATATDPDLPLPVADTGLGRVRLAHARDQLEVAHQAWKDASRGLTQTIQGITKAPPDYRDAITLLLAERQPSLKMRMAITAALPRLGYDAVQTIRRMSETGELITHRPVFCQPRNAWQPITPDQGAELAGRFHLASRASVPAAAAVRDLLPSQSSPAAGAPAAGHGPARVRELGRGVTR